MTDTTREDGPGSGPGTSHQAPLARSFPCGGCGATLAFSPGMDSLTCPHCGTENAIAPDADGEDDPIEELDYEAALANALEASEVEETAVVDCPGCGAQITLDVATHSDECPFCATPLVSTTKRHRHPKVQAVLPFAIDEGTAKGKFKEWLGSLWFAPSKLSEYASAGRPMQGVYIPHYTYDAMARARYKGQRGDAYYVTQTFTTTDANGKTVREQRQVRKIRWTAVRGRITHHFDDVLVPASETLFREKVEERGAGWDLAALEPYRDEYVVGFRSEAPARSLDEGFGRAKSRMESTLETLVRRDIGGDEQRIIAMESEFQDITFKHVLLPVWLAAYRFKDKGYRVIVNGRNGVITGERPYSWSKIIGAVAAAVVVIGGLIWLFS